MAKIVTHHNLKSYFGEEDHLSLAQSSSFSQLIYNLLAEKAPTDAELKLFELILNISIDHGPDTPSAIKVIEQSTAGQSLSQSIAAGIEQINDSHGGAAEPLMKKLYEIKQGKLTCKDLVAWYLSNHQKLPGFGHRLYKESDPRAQLILEYTKKIPQGLYWIDLAKKLESELASQSGKILPLNVDGAIAVALCTLEWEPRLGKVIFIIARTPGLCAHFLNNSSL